MKRSYENSKCYNCGVPLKREEIHDEHIPARNLFEGFPESHKANRITIDACFTCNNKFSVIDEEFRNFIGTINKHPEANGIVQKAITSIERLFSKRARVIYSVAEKKPSAVQFDRNQIDAYHVKNFKGVFYHNYKMPLPEDYKIVVYSDETKKSQTGIRLLDYLQNNFKMKVSGHEDVFRYIIQPLRTNCKLDGSDLEPVEGDKFLAILSYTKNHAALVFARK